MNAPVGWLAIATLTTVTALTLLVIVWHHGRASRRDEQAAYDLEFQIITAPLEDTP